MRVADECSVRRPKRLQIVKIKNRKHPCFGEHGLFAGEDIEKGVALLDYAGNCARSSAPCYQHEAHDPDPHHNPNPNLNLSLAQT